LDFNHAIALSTSGSFGQAVDLLTGCVERDPKFGEALWKIASIIEKWKSCEPIPPHCVELQKTSLRRLLEIEPDHVEGNVLMGMLGSQLVESESDACLRRAASLAVRLQQELLDGMM
jgi:hypothetical protein